jgi:hypothetical protein
MYLLETIYFRISQRCETADQTLKEEASFPADSTSGSRLSNTAGVLCTAPILAYPQWRERFVIDTTVSNIRIGGVLSQVHDR